jgi:putative transposase
MTSHVRRYHRHYRSSGHVWQGRCKAFPIEQDEHLLTVMRYVEPNPVRAKSVEVCSEVKLERIHGRNALIDQAQRNDLFPVRR